MALPAPAAATMIETRETAADSAEPSAGVPTGRITRRRFLGAGAAAGFCLALEIPLRAAAQAATRSTFGDTQLAAYLEITPDNVVHFTLPDAEMGQGIFSALPLILADELGADWESLDVRQSGADDRLANPMKGFQATGRSMSVRGYYPLLRRLGATARELLCQAAAERWKVPAAECTTERSRVVHRASARSATFAELLEAASALPLPLEVRLKPPGELRLIGQDIPRKDIPAKVTGRAGFGVDVQLPGLLVAAIRQSPVFGSTVVSVDGKAAEAMPGVRAVVPLKDAVAVVAGDFWQARTALAAVKVSFAPGANDAVDSDSLRVARVAGLAEEGVTGRADGDAAGTLKKAARRLDLRYEVPYLAHATMEPMTCTAWLKDGGCELWAPTQGPGRLRNEVAKALGLDPGRVRINRMFLGGGFGRRWQVDFGVQAALVARAVGQPVKLIWSREEDMQHDFYRPAMLIQVQAGLGRDKRLAALDIKLVGALLSTWGKPPVAEPKPDSQLLGGLVGTAYALPDWRVRWVPRPTHVPIGVWRSVAHSHNAFALECALDEAAAAAGRDPVEFRLDLLGASPRHRRVLESVAAQSGWGTTLPKGEGRGIALAEYGGSVIAAVVHVVRQGERIRLQKVDAVADCGFVVQPRNVIGQLEGGIVFGLSAACHGEIGITAGHVAQSNFHDYRLLMLADTPAMDVRLIPGDGPPGGVGETGVPVAAPALCNAVFAATGRRIRSLPLARAGLM